MIRNTWYVAGFTRNFHYKLEKKVIAGRPIVMWRTTDDRVVAYDGRCCHKRFPLWKGKLLDDGTLQCGYHGWCYDSSGACVKMPNQPNVAISPAAHLHPYPVIEQDGLVWLWPGEPSLCADVKPPRIPELADPQYEAVVSEPIYVRANSRLLLENLLDITHFFPLHDGNIGDYENSKIPVGLREDTIDGNAMVMTTRNVSDYRLPPSYARWFGLDIADRDHTHAMLSPGLVRVQLRLAPPGQLDTPEEVGYVLCHTDTPIDDEHLVWHWIMIAKAGARFPADRSMTLAQGMALEFPAVVADDEWALAEQQKMLEFPEALPTGTRYRETNIRSDIGVVHARRVLSRMEKAEGNELYGSPAATLEMATQLPESVLSLEQARL
ncbi:MAG: aromatic ring-hydroxylating dioxygenase subunit alpha [Candidatus Eremiobacteraeota bacterium]|nr:aromatic ring-hydroxylating dioxygenase subunit alpha [Candidatus Eremiobacteraeota bacterium]